MNKPQIRTLYLKKRCQVNPEHIAVQLGRIFSQKPMKMLHSFIGDLARNEIDTKHIRLILQREFPEMKWAAPRMIPGTKRLEHCAWNDETELIANRWGIEEPDPETSQSIEIREIDAVLVPLVAFDQQGHRVGYGGGYYDRFLAQCRPDTLKIGLSHFEPIEAMEDVDEWDIKLDTCVTPDAIYSWDK